MIRYCGTPPDCALCAIRYRSDVLPVINGCSAPILGTRLSRYVQHCRIEGKHEFLRFNTTIESNARSPQLGSTTSRFSNPRGLPETVLPLSVVAHCSHLEVLALHLDVRSLDDNRHVAQLLLAGPLVGRHDLHTD